MHELLRQLSTGFAFSGSVERDAPRFLVHHECPKTAAHSARVAREAARVARLVGADPVQAEVAGWLHDISAVFPPAGRAEVARQLGLEVLPEEDAFPMIIHQKLSTVIARELFGVSDPAVLSAIGCHTTLKRDASLLDRVLFVADKIEWDQPDTAPYLDRVLAGLERSLDQAALAYLTWMWESRASLRVVHPWLREAYEQLSGRSWEG
ncbi:MAG: bis(5'-nucleosyl)-tetraphosphatase (symmetrical) YqeK [Bacillota bacterium]